MSSDQHQDLCIQKNPYLRGASEMYEDGVLVTVDLGILVDTHICVYEDISSYGRYLCFNHVINTQHDAVQLAHKTTTPLRWSMSLAHCFIGVIPKFFVEKENKEIKYSKIIFFL